MVIQKFGRRMLACSQRMQGKGSVLVYYLLYFGLVFLTTLLFYPRCLILIYIGLELIFKSDCFFLIVLLL